MTVTICDWCGKQVTSVCYLVLKYPQKSSLDSEGEEDSGTRMNHELCTECSGRINTLMQSIKRAIK